MVTPGAAASSAELALEAEGADTGNTGSWTAQSPLVQTMSFPPDVLGGGGPRLLAQHGTA